MKNKPFENYDFLAVRQAKQIRTLEAEIERLKAVVSQANCVNDKPCPWCAAVDALKGEGDV